MWLTLEQTSGLSQGFPLAPSLSSHHTQALAKVESPRPTSTRDHTRRESALRMSHRTTFEDSNSENRSAAADESPGMSTLPKNHHRTSTSPAHLAILQSRSDNIQTIPRNRTTSAFTPPSHKLTEHLDFSPLTPRRRPTPAPASAAATPSPSSAQPPCRPPKSIHRSTPKASAGATSCLLEQVNPIAFLSSNSPLQDLIDRAQAAAPDPTAPLIRSDSDSTLGKQSDHPAPRYIPSIFMPQHTSAHTSSKPGHFLQTMLPAADPTNPAKVKYLIPYINSPGLGEESGTDEFASAEEGDESVWTGDREPEYDESFECMRRWAQSDTISLEQPARLPTGQSRPSLPHHWTAPHEDAQAKERKSESRAHLSSYDRQLSDQLPKVSHSMQSHKPAVDLNQPTSQKMERRSGRLTSHPVTRSLSKAFGGVELANSTSNIGKKHSISERPRLRTSSSSLFLGLRSSSSHSRPRYSTVQHSADPDSESSMLGSFEMPSRPLNKPFLTPTYSNNGVDQSRAGPQSVSMVRTFSAIGGLAATRHRQLTDERRSSSSTALRQLSSLFHPRSRDSSFDGTNGHFVRPKIHSALSTHSISTLASTAASLSLTWRNTVAGDEYGDLVAEHGSMEMRRQEVIWELCQTEEAFIASLKTVIEIFVDPLRRADKQWISDVPPRVSSLFESLEEIINIHTQISEAIKSDEEKLIVERIADRWLSYVPKLEVHQSYLANFELVNRLLEEMTGDRGSDFGEFVRMQSELDSCGKMSLSSFLLKPVQRLMKYPLFFKQLRDLTPPMHVDHLSTIALLEATDDIIRVMQEVKGREDDYMRAKTLESQIKQLPLPGGLKLAIRDRKLLGQGVLKQVHVSSANKLAPPLRQPQSRPVSQFSNESEFGGSTSTRTDCSSCCSDEPPKTPLDQYDHFLNSPDLVPPSPSSLVRRPSRLSGPARFLAGGGTTHKDSKVSVFVFNDVMVVLSNRISDTLIRKRASSKKGSAIEYQLVDEIGICKIIGVEDRSAELGHERLIKVRVCSLMPSEQQQREQVVHFAVEEEKDFGRWIGWMERSSLAEVRREEVRTLARSRSVREAAGVTKAAPEERTWWKERFRIVRSEMIAAEYHAR